jgi:hypothetical protein
MSLSLLDDFRSLMLRVMGTKASRNRLREREREFAAAFPRIRRGGKTFAPGTREYQRVTRMMAETLSDEEARPILEGRLRQKS